MKQTFERGTKNVTDVITYYTLNNNLKRYFNVTECISFMQSSAFSFLLLAFQKHQLVTLFRFKNRHMNC